MSGRRGIDRGLVDVVRHRLCRVPVLGVAGATFALTLFGGSAAATIESETSGASQTAEAEDLSPFPPIAWLRRPVRVPKLSPGEPCPKTPGRPANEYSAQFGVAPALGHGPIFPVPATVPLYEPESNGYEGAIHFGASRRVQGWYGVKVLWIAPASYRGWALIRGTRLDRKMLLRFDRNDPLAPHMWLRSWDNAGDEWQFWTSLVRLRAGGCYAVQIDGRSFSRTVIFRAAR